MSTQGLALDERFDLVFDESGDAAFSVGMDEVQKMLHSLSQIQLMNHQSVT